MTRSAVRAADCALGAAASDAQSASSEQAISERGSRALRADCVEPFGHLPAGRAAVGDAVGNADAAKAAAGDEQAGMPRERALDRLEPRQVADLVLRARALPAVDAREERLAA